MSGKKSGKKKICVYGIIVALIILVCGVIVVVAAINKEESTQEEEWEEQEDKEKEEDNKKDESKAEEVSDSENTGGFMKYVDTSRKSNDCMTIGSMMDVLCITAADPSIDWKTEEVTVIFTQDGGKYICGNADVIKYMSDIMPEESANVSQWGDGWEIRAQKDLSTGVPVFSFIGDYEALKEFKPELAARFESVLEN